MISDKGKLKESLKGISKENYILLRRVFLKFYKQGKEIINLSDVIFYIKDHHQDLEKKIKEGCEFSDDSDELEDLDLENIDKIQDRLYMANKKLNKAVLAVPTWRKPVGEGAILKRGPNKDCGVEGSGVILLIID